MSNKQIWARSFCLKLYNKRDFKAYEVRKTAVYFGVNEDFECEYKVAFQRGQRLLADYAERSNQKELNAEITLLESF